MACMDFPSDAADC